MRRLARRGAALLGTLIALYGVAAVALGLLPANRGYVAPADGIELAITSNGFHADVILPMQAAGIDWAPWCPPETFGGVPAAHIAFGWGDRDFYVATPGTTDIKPLTALKAVSFSTTTVLHVIYVDDVAALTERRRIVVSPDSYRRLAAYIQASFRLDPAGRTIARPERGYHARDAFFEAVGIYSPLMTCNEWLAAGLRRAGIPTGWWAPFAFGITAHL
jgi:uncharacterized protein (TIGR02117 family)